MHTRCILQDATLVIILIRKITELHQKNQILMEEKESKEQRLPGSRASRSICSKMEGSLIQLLRFGMHFALLEEGADFSLALQKNTEQNTVRLDTLIVTYKFLSISHYFQLPSVCTVIMDAQRVTETSVEV